MTIEEQIELLKKEYTVLGVVNLDEMHQDFVVGRTWLDTQCKNLRKEVFENNERIVFVITQDVYDNTNQAGIRLRTLQKVLNYIDITNCFAVVVSTNKNLEKEIQLLTSKDSTAIECYIVNGEFAQYQTEEGSKFEDYRYGSPEPLKISLNELDDRKKFLLTKSKTFCMYPWIHIHAHPTGEAHPCCHADMQHKIGSCKNNSLKEIWNDSGMRELRLNMLNERKSATCAECYEHEEHGFFSGRQSANKHHGHQISKIDETKEDGTFERFELTYWDIRYSNLCNLRCRSCGHIFSSQWYQDQVKLAGPEWAKNNRVLNYAGRTETDIWEQLAPHLDYVEQIYFAGGEPLMMEEHYNILDELERRGRFDVRLIYNTNFTHVKLKDRYVFDYWKKFKSVSVGASLDAMGPRAEYIRKGTEWDVVERNRVKMLEMCPDVDFYISPTLSIMNALHLPEFHRNWTERGFIKAQDLNVNCLLFPTHYRLDIAPPALKEKICNLYREHLEWLKPQDPLKRATIGFESAINFITATDNTHLIETFWKKTLELDAIRNENLLDIIPELKELK